MSNPVKSPRKLVFDGDGSQYTDSGSPCDVCGVRQQISEAPTIFVRVREKIPGGTRHLMLFCPTCIARMFLQVERLSLWSQVNSTVLNAIKNLFAKRWLKEQQAEAKANPSKSSRKALGSVPGAQLPSRGLEKLLPGKKG